MFEPVPDESTPLVVKRKISDRKCDHCEKEGPDVDLCPECDLFWTSQCSKLDSELLVVKAENKESRDQMDELQARITSLEKEIEKVRHHREGINQTTSRKCPNWMGCPRFFF